MKYLDPKQSIAYSAITRLPATANCTYSPLLTTNNMNNNENGEIAVNINDSGFLLNQRNPVIYAMIKICLVTT